MTRLTPLLPPLSYWLLQIPPSVETQEGKQHGSWFIVKSRALHVLVGRHTPITVLSVCVFTMQLSCACRELALGDRILLQCPAPWLLGNR